MHVWMNSGIFLSGWMILANHPPSQNHMDDGSPSSTLGVDDWAILQSSHLAEAWCAHKNDKQTTVIFVLAGGHFSLGWCWDDDLLYTIAPYTNDRGGMMLGWLSRPNGPQNVEIHSLFSCAGRNSLKQAKTGLGCKIIRSRLGWC